MVAHAAVAAGEEEERGALKITHLSPHRVTTNMLLPWLLMVVRRSILRNKKIRVTFTSSSSSFIRHKERRKMIKQRPRRNMRKS